STEATALRRPSSENASAAKVMSRPATAILLLSSTVSLSADVERAARSVSRGEVLVQAAIAQKTTNGITPGHHLLLHLKNPCIRCPGIGSREKTNRCEAVKLEITGSSPVPNRFPITSLRPFDAGFALT